LIGHHPLERLIHQPRIRGLLDGVTAAVVGLIAGTAITLCVVTVNDLQTAAVFLFAVTVAFISRNKLVIPLIVAAAIAWGLIVSAMTN
jgi:chromate transporter